MIDFEGGRTTFGVRGEMKSLKGVIWKTQGIPYIRNGALGGEAAPVHDDHGRSFQRFNGSKLRSIAQGMYAYAYEVEESEVYGRCITRYRAKWPRGTREMMNKACQA
jgi:hypothetical protein